MDGVHRFFQLNQQVRRLAQAGTYDDAVERARSQRRFQRQLTGFVGRDQAIDNLKPQGTNAIGLLPDEGPDQPGSQIGHLREIGVSRIKPDRQDGTACH